MADPRLYARLYATLRRRRRAERVRTWVVATLVTALLVPLVRPVFLHFLGAPERTVDGLREVWIRAACVLLITCGLAVHASVLRGAARPVLALHPVDPVAVVRAELREAAGAQLVVLLGLAGVLCPIAVELDVWAWTLGVIVLLGAWASSLVVSTLAFLAAVDVAERPSFAPLLDALRGNNPRPQAALIYALVPTGLVAGEAVMLAADGASRVWAGQPGGWVTVSLPFVVAAVGAPLIAPLSSRTWYRASLVLAEIRARYERVLDPEDARRVAWDWTVGRLPADVAREAVLVLRSGWRERRGLLSAAWLVALAAVVVGWTVDPIGPTRAALVAATGPWLVGVPALLAARDEPTFLHTWLARSGRARGLGAAWATLCWSAPTLGAALATAVVRHGASGLVAWAQVVGVALPLAVAATAVGVTRRAGLTGHVAGAVLVTAALAAWRMGGGLW